MEVTTNLLINSHLDPERARTLLTDGVDEKLYMDWCAENCTGDYQLVDSGYMMFSFLEPVEYTITIDFENASDAAAFKEAFPKKAKH